MSIVLASHIQSLLKETYGFLRAVLEEKKTAQEEKQKGLNFAIKIRGLRKQNKYSRITKE